jgi:hypothetical protein
MMKWNMNSDVFVMVASHGCLESRSFLVLHVNGE